MLSARSMEREVQTFRRSSGPANEQIEWLQYLPPIVPIPNSSPSSLRGCDAFESGLQIVPVLKVALHGIRFRAQGLAVGTKGLLAVEIRRVLANFPVEYAEPGGDNMRPVSKQTRLPRAVRHGFQELKDIVEYLDHSQSHPISRSALVATVDLLVDSLTNSSVYPSLSEDGEGGVFIEWWADTEHLSAEVNQLGKVTVVWRDIATGERRQTEDARKLRAEVRDLSELVRLKAPNWREHFDDYRARF